MKHVACFTLVCFSLSIYSCQEVSNACITGLVECFSRCFPSESVEEEVLKILPHSIENFKPTFKQNLVETPVYTELSQCAGPASPAVFATPPSYAENPVIVIGSSYSKACQAYRGPSSTQNQKLELINPSSQDILSSGDGHVFFLDNTTMCTIDRNSSDAELGTVTPNSYKFRASMGMGDRCTAYCGVHTGNTLYLGSDANTIYAKYINMHAYGDICKYSAHMDKSLSHVNAITLADPTTLIAATDNGSAFVFDTETKALQNSHEWDFRVYTLAHTSPTTLYFGGEDTHVHAWDLRSPKANTVVYNNAPTYALATLEKYLVVGTKGNSLQLYDFRMLSKCVQTLKVNPHSSIYNACIKGITFGEKNDLLLLSSDGTLSYWQEH